MMAAMFCRFAHTIFLQPYSLFTW